MTAPTAPTVAPTRPLAVGPSMTPVIALGDIAAVTRRNLLRILRTPQLLVFSSIQPVMFVLLFRYVFGGAIPIPGFRYVDYLMPGIFVQTTLFGSAAAAVGLAQDLKGGIIDRFRSLPMARSAVLAGRTLADLGRNLFVTALMVTVGTLVGFRFHGGLVPGVAAIVLVLVFGYAFSWIFAATGLFVKDPETAQIAGFIPMFPLVFASSAFVPVQRHRERGSRADPGHTGGPLALAVGRLDHRDPRGVHTAGRPPVPADLTANGPRGGPAGAVRTCRPGYLDGACQGGRPRSPARLTALSAPVKGF